MGRFRLVIFLVITVMMSGFSGCLGLLQARETIEELRDDVYTVTYPDHTNMQHTFETFTLDEYNNYTSFSVDNSVERIEIYYKVVMSGSDTISCIDDIFTKPFRYVTAQMTSPSGNTQWSIDVCRDVAPNSDVIETNSSFEVGDWGFEVEARGLADASGLTPVADNFNFIITVYRECQQYPIEPPCDQ